MTNDEDQAFSSPLLDVLRDKSQPSTIVGVTANHWRADRPHGVQVAAQFEGESGNEFRAQVERIQAAADLEGYMVEKALRALGAIHARNDWSLGAKPGQADAFAAVVLIGWLESRNHIVSDEYNGVGWIVKRGGVLAMLRQDEPSPDEVRAAQASFGVDLEVSSAPASERRKLINDLLGRALS